MGYLFGSMGDMARRPRLSGAGIAYHVMNRTWGQIQLFEDASDYQAFERVLAEASERFSEMRICAYCLMPNHFHLVLWPKAEGVLSCFMQWLTQTHAARWHAHRRSRGRGHLYQGRFKSFPIQRDEHFLKVCRYVERNALRAQLVDKAEEWRWGSLWVRVHDEVTLKQMLSDWPVRIPDDWVRLVNRAQTEKELAAIRRSRERGVPMGDPDWAQRTAKQLGLESTLRPVGRPRKEASA
ncbi:MAG: transposase [Methylacidiphilales bacterium]|nr:transposase [Candidatus Methylacidiphilales bacterium]